MRRRIVSLLLGAALAMGFTTTLLPAVHAAPTPDTIDVKSVFSPTTLVAGSAASVNLNISVTVVGNNLALAWSDTLPAGLTPQAASFVLYCTTGTTTTPYTIPSTGSTFGQTSVTLTNASCSGTLPLTIDWSVITPSGSPYSDSITATNNKVTPTHTNGTLTITPPPVVDVPVTGVALDKASATLVVDDTLTLTATVSPSDARDQTVMWSSSDETVATVDSSGLVTAVAAGSATITVTTNDGGFTASADITVNEPIVTVSVTGVTLDKASATLVVGDTLTLTATVAPSDATDQTVMWSSNDETVATVDSSGLGTAIAAGSATITVTTNDGGFTASADVTVTDTSESPILVTSITIHSYCVYYDMIIHDLAKMTDACPKMQMSVTVEPSDATDPSVTWSVEPDTGTATIDSTGLLTAGNNGTVTVVATANDGSDVRGTLVVTINVLNKMVRFTESPDMTGDGRGEVLAVDFSGVLWMYPGTASGQLGPRINLGSNFQDKKVFGPGDINGDGRADVLAIDSAGNLLLYPGQGAKALGAVKQVGNGWTGWRLIPAGDLTGDGKPDLLGIDSLGDLYMYAGKGGGLFAMKVKVGNGWNGWDLYAAGDLNGDGKNDILGIDGVGNLFQYAGKGSWTFAMKVQAGNGWIGFTLASGGDLNGDGLADITGRNDDTGELFFYRGMGNAKFAMKVRIATGW